MAEIHKTGNQELLDGKADGDRAGYMRTMPGLGKHPAAERIDIDADGNVTGLF